MIETSDIVKENQIVISEDDWTEYKKEYSEEELKSVISSAIDEYSIPMPLRNITEDQAKHDFERLLSLDTTHMISRGETYSRYEYERKLSDIYIAQSKVGNISSDYYQQYNRFLCDSVNSPSPYRSWYNPKFRKGILSALFTLKFKQVKVYEFPDGSIRVKYGNRELKTRKYFDKLQRVLHGEIVSNKRLGSTLGKIQIQQKERNEQLAKRKSMCHLNNRVTVDTPETNWRI